MCDMPARWRASGVRERGSEGGLRGRLREVPESGQWTPRKRSSDERSGGLSKAGVRRLPPIGEPISGGLVRVWAGSGREVRCFGVRFGARSGDILERPAMVRWGASEWTVALGTRPTKDPDATVHPGCPRRTVASATRRDHSGGHFGAHFGGHFGDMLE